MDKAKRYNNIKLALNLGGTLSGWLFMLAIVLLGFSSWTEVLVSSVTSSPYLALLAFGAIIGIVETILFFPLSFYGGYILEHKYGLSNHTLRSYFWEKFKAFGVGLVIGVPLLLVFYYLLRTFPEIWWLYVGVFMFLVSVVLGRLAPTLIFPLFYKFKPIDDETVAATIRKRCGDAGMKVEGIFQFDMSKTTKKANAAFTGIGRSKRVILGDTLLEEFDHDEIDAVLTHELGHFKMKHLWKMMAIGTLFTFVGLYLVSVAYAAWIERLGFENITQLATLPLLTLLFGIYSFVSGPVQNSISRRHERQADRFSVEMRRDSSAMARALEKLADQNLADREPHPVVEFLFHSHPSIENRIAHLRAQPVET
tara:strand:- start:2423 stop:3523 length:1101 start_codon:yes stop_codon:yes gene_type:complete